MMQPLDFMQLPFNGTSLIEASAGTGKTYTIAALYLRLVLGHGLTTALRPDQILVVTFTEAATAELKGRIQSRLSEAAAAFRGELAAPDTVLCALLDAFPTAQHHDCAVQLELAAQWMDEAAIATIHGWCNRMLSEHAFYCASQFSQQLVTDVSRLQQQAVMDYWRSYVYPLQTDIFIRYQQSFATPAALWQALLPLWSEALDAPAQSLSELIAQEQQAKAQQLQALKAPWQHWLEELAQLLASGRANGHTDNRKLRPDYVDKWLQGLAAWRDDPASIWPDIGKGLERLTPDGLAQAWKGPAPSHPALDAIAQLPAALGALPDVSFSLRTHALVQIRAQFQHLQQQRGELGFDDLLSQLDRALHGSQGDALAAVLRRQYPLALIDEFQDTDPIQWRIFSRIYQPQPAQKRPVDGSAAGDLAASAVAGVAESADESAAASAPEQAAGLLLIGDPKQAIYGFRGADIYTYLAAKQQTLGRHYSLGTNFRSSTAMVAAVNQLFMLAEQREAGQGAFLFRDDRQLLPFLPVAAKGRTEQLVLEDVGLPALQWQLLATPDKPLSKSAYLQQSAEQCARQLVQLLNAGAAGRAGFASKDGLQPLNPADIAVLVNNQQEASLIRTELMRYQVRAVYLSDKGSVFDSPLASELWLWLSACAQPRQAQLVRAALATPTLARSYTELLRLQQDDWALEQMQQQFLNYQSIWRQQGVLALVHRLLQDFELVRLLASQPDAERQLTDLLHMAELLQQAARQLDGEAALLRYLQQHLSGAGELGADELKLRLESDEALVRIVTIHKSKGLEYPLVFLPFLLSARELDPGRLPYVWHTPDGRRHLATAYDESSFAQAEQERLGEDLRKLYVALTRARHYCWVALAPLKERSALGYLLDPTGRLDPVQLATPADHGLPAVLRCEPCFALQTESPPEPLPYRSALTTTHRTDGFLTAGPAGRPAWYISSYSAIAAAQEAAADDLRAAKAAELWRAQQQGPADAQLPVAERSSFAASFSRGAKAGTFLHEQLEWAANLGFAAALAAPDLLDAQLVQSAAQYGLLRQRPDGQWQRLMTASDLEAPCLFSRAEDAVAALSQWLQTLLNWQLPLGRPATLATLPAYQAELEFLLPADKVELKLLDQLVQRFIWPGQPRPVLQARQLNGMLKGFIDLALCDGETYYVADFKSNYRADGDYSEAALVSAMLQARYDLQAALYGLALYRLLRSRGKEQLPGPALYWFLRGAAEGTSPSQQDAGGVLAVPLDGRFIKALDAMFAGNSSPARQLLQTAWEPADAAKI